jgi:8-amino-7-oxononanoate synthase
LTREQRRTRLQNNIQRFYEKITGHSEWAKCVFGGILSLPTQKTWHTGSFQTPIIPLITELGQATKLTQKLHEAGYQVNSVFYPIVPRDKERVRLVIHADNTTAQIDEVVDLIMNWSRSRLADQLKRSNPLVSGEDMYQDMAFSD